MPHDWEPIRDGRLDDQAMSALWREHERSLAAYIGSRLPVGLRGVIGVEDVLQETQASAWSSRVTFRFVSPLSFLCWVRAIADRKLIDIKRAAGRARRGGARRHQVAPRNSSGHDAYLLAAATAKTPSRQASIREAVAELEAAMKLLPNQMREALKLCELGGKSVQDAARIMQRSPGSVRGLLYHGRNKLRAILGAPCRLFSDS